MMFDEILRREMTSMLSRVAEGEGLNLVELERRGGVGLGLIHGAGLDRLAPGRPGRFRGGVGDGVAGGVQCVRR